MINKYNRLAIPIFYIIDIILIIFSFHLGYVLDFGWTENVFLPSSYRFFLLFAVLAWSVLVPLFRIHLVEHAKPLKKHLAKYFNSQICFLFLISGFALAGKFYSSSRLFIAYFVCLEILLTLAFRLVRHKLVLEYRRRGYNYRNAIVIGSNGGLADHVSDWIMQHPESGLKLESELSCDELAKESARSLRLLLAEREIDYVFVVSSEEMESQMSKVVSAADNGGTRVRIISPYLQRLSGRIKCSTLAGLPVFSLRNEPLELLHNRIMKRALDIFVGFAINATINIWLIPIVGLMIRLTSKGPVMFRQRRIGRDGKGFIVYKLRTMSNNHHKKPEEALAGMGEITKKDDARVTWIGKWLRAANVDEFPQFLNILLGNMSTVGPRPHMVSEDEELEEILDKYPVRRLVKPGLTGWAQVNGYRGGTEDMTLMQKRTDYDIWYIENWSIWLDIKIIVLTFWRTVIGRTGAY